MNLNNRTRLIIGGSFLLVIAGFIGLSSFDNADLQQNAEDTSLSAENSQATLYFDLPAHQYEVEEGVVAKNEFLSTILQRYQIDLGTVSELAEKSKAVYDVRRISAGNPYTVFKDADGKAAYFVYQPNKIEYVTYRLTDGIDVSISRKEVISEIRTVTGVINNSLYQALDEQSVNPDMATKLAEIYGWAVNFYSIRKGDWFKIMYENREVDGETVGSGKILSAVFSHQGKEYEAYYFETDEEGKGTYYDEQGNSLRRAFLKAPLKYSRISSRFSPRRLHPVQGVWKAHLGTDFAAPQGTPIVATGDGMVIASAYAGGNGNYVKIQHDNVYATQYLHMSKRAVKRGDRVKQGQVIGYVGSTGLATGPHVCYRFWKNGQQVDALKQEFPSAEPIGTQYKLAYSQHIATHRNMLARVNPLNPVQRPSLREQQTFNMEKLLANAWADDAQAPAATPFGPRML